VFMSLGRLRLEIGIYHIRTCRGEKMNRKLRKLQKKIRRLQWWEKTTLMDWMNEWYADRKQQWREEE